MANISLTPAMRTNLLSLQGTSKLMDTTQNRISTGLKVGSALDNPTAFFTAKGLSNSASDLATLKDSMGQGISTIQSADGALVSIQRLVDQMKGITASAKAASTTAVRADLATQYDDLRGQIDALAADATYNGKNLVFGRGVITGGTFSDTTATAISDLSGVSANGIVRTGTSTDISSFTLSTVKKVNTLATTATIAADANTNVGNVYLDGVNLGSVTRTSSDATATAASIAALSADLTSSGATLTVASGKVLEIRDATAGAAFDSALASGLVNDVSGAQVKNLTSSLGIYGGEVYAHVSGYTNNQTDTNLVFTVSADKATLTVTDAVGGTSASIATSSFSSGGTDTLTVGDLTVNFVTSVADENANTAPAVVSSRSAIAQVNTATISGDAAVAQIDTVTLTGTVTTGDVFRSVLGGTTFEYTATGGEANITAIAAGLSTVITANAAYGSTNTGGVITITAAVAGTAFSNVSTVPTDTGGANTAVAATTTVNETKGYDSGDAFSLVVNGNTYTQTLGAAQTSATGVVTATFAAFKTAVESVEGVTLTNTGASITVTANTAGQSFTFGASQTAGVQTGESMTAATSQANVTSQNTITISGQHDDGDVVTATVNGTTVSYTVLASDVSATATTTEDNVAAGLIAAINANTTLVNGTAGLLATATVGGGASANVITISENGSGTTLTATTTATDAAISLGNESKLTSTQDLKSMTTGTADGDLRVNVTSGGVTQAVDISTSNTTAVTISNAAFGSTFSITADDAAMVAGETTTISVSNATGVGANDMKVNFNADSTAFVNTQAVSATTSGLGIMASANGFASDSDIDSAIANLTSATTSLRTSSQSLATNLGIIQTRENFTAGFMNVLQAGADKLTLADSNEEAANMLALQTRQQLGIQSLSMASQAAQSILGLFR